MLPTLRLQGVFRRWEPRGPEGLTETSPFKFRMGSIPSSSGKETLGGLQSWHGHVYYLNDGPVMEFFVYLPILILVVHLVRVEAAPILFPAL